MLSRQELLAFVNTRLDRPDELVEDLPDRAAATRWLVDELGFDKRSALTADDHAALVRLRAAVRDLIAARIAGHQAPADGVDLLNRSSAAAPRYALLTGDWQQGVAYSSLPSGRSTAFPQLLAELAAAAIDLLSNADADLAECAAEDCVVLFLRNDPRRQWHSDRCGNRVRAARSYARHRHERASS